VKLTPVSDVAPVGLRMVWRRRIPAATLSVIAGKPGLGKSTLALTIAADLSRRRKASIISNLEDDPAAVIRPRLDVAEADLGRVHLIPADQAPMLPRDLPELRDLVRDTRAACLILDPIAAHFRPERRVHDRAVLGDLLQLARETGCAVIGVHHTTKTSVDGSAIGAIGGPTGGLSGAARAVYLYGHDPDDEDRRALACAKVNGIDEPPALLIEHTTVEYPAGGRVIEAGLLRFRRESNARAVKLLKPGKHKRDRDAEAAEWLTTFLASGQDCQRPVREIRGLGEASGFGWQTLRRAGVQLQVEHVRVGWGEDGYWLWRLPEEHPSRSGEAV
jgi:putative DNA primase/helicase